MNVDIAIPVFNSPEWLERCLRSVFEVDRSQSTAKVILINDASDSQTVNLIEQWREKDPARLVVLSNLANIGFVGSINRSITWFLSESRSDALVLLNSDCLLADKTIDHLANHFVRVADLGMICPLSNNSANLSIQIPPGFDYRTFSRWLGREFPNQSRRACTVTGNCLAISRACLQTVGLLDTAYGTGYGEESDYHYRSIAAGFRCEVALDAFVYHFASASFGNGPSMVSQKQSNHSKFMDRWGAVYLADLDAYSRSDPILEISTRLQKRWSEIRNPPYTHLYLLPGLASATGGIRIVVELCNEMILRGERPQIYLTEPRCEYDGAILFTPLCRSYGGPTTSGRIPHGSIDREFCQYPYYDETPANPGQIKLHPNLLSVHATKIIGTSWETFYPAFVYSRRRRVPFFGFSQGWELNFGDTAHLTLAAEAISLPDQHLAVSKWIQARLKRYAQTEALHCPNGIDCNLFWPSPMPPQGTALHIATFLRGGFAGSLKGDRTILDLIPLIASQRGRFRLTVVAPRNPLNELVEIRFGLSIVESPISQVKLANLLRSADIYLDASPQEGFGLLPLEAMACGAVPVIVRSGGSEDFLEDQVNGVFVERQDAENMLDAIEQLAASRERLGQLRSSAIRTARVFSLTAMTEAHISAMEPVVECLADSPKRAELIARTSDQNCDFDLSEIRKLGLCDSASAFYLASSLADDAAYRRKANPKP